MKPSIGAKEINKELANTSDVRELINRRTDLENELKVIKSDITELEINKGKFEIFIKSKENEI